MLAALVAAAVLAAPSMETAPTADGGELSAEQERVARIVQSVVYLAILDQSGQEISNGTGFLVDAQGTVVTNQHVVEDAAGLEATLANGQKRKVLGVVATGEVKSNDLAVIRLEKGNYLPLPLSLGRDLKAGSLVTVVGSPEGLGFTASEGIVSALRPEGMPRKRGEEPFYTGPLIQISVPIAGGSSGSPIVDRAGEVVGVVQAGFNGAGDINFAVPVSAVRLTLASIPPGKVPGPLRPFPLRNVLISAGAFLAVAVWWMRGKRGAGRPVR